MGFMNPVQILDGESKHIKRSRPYSLAAAQADEMQEGGV